VTEGESRTESTLESASEQRAALKERFGISV